MKQKMKLPASDNSKINNRKNARQKITIFSKHLHWLGIDAMAETTAEMGFDGVDLTVRPGGHVIPENVEDELPGAAELFNKAGVDIVMLCTTIQDVTQPLTEKILKTANQLGIKYYRMDWYHYDRTIGIDQNLEDFQLKMQDLAGMNEHYGIRGAYQNHDGTWFGAPVWDVGIILKKINSDWLGLQYDILNASIEGTNSWNLGLEWIAHNIHTIDIKDGKWFKENDKWQVDYLPLGDGDVDYKTFTGLLNKLDISVPFSMHFEYDLGGAEIGADHLTVPKQTVLDAMKKDLKTFEEYLI